MLASQLCTQIPARPRKSGMPACCKRLVFGCGSMAWIFDAHLHLLTKCWQSRFRGGSLRPTICKELHGFIMFYPNQVIDLRNHGLLGLQRIVQKQQLSNDLKFDQRSNSSIDGPLDVAYPWLQPRYSHIRFRVIQDAQDGCQSRSGIKYQV